MKTDVLEQILGGLKGVKKEGGRFQVAEACFLTVMAQMGQELLTLARVVQIEVAKEICVVATAKHERYFLPAELILAIKVEQEEASGSPFAGFR